MVKDAGQGMEHNAEWNMEDKAGQDTTQKEEDPAIDLKTDAGMGTTQSIGQEMASCASHTGQPGEQHPEQHINQQTGHNPVHAPIPGLGLRSMKTALAAVLTALLYAFLPGSNPTFACIGAIFGMGADMEDSRRSGGNRFFGTIIGGFIGLGLYWLEHQVFPEGCYWLRLPLVFLGIVVMISMCVLFHWPGGVQPGGVVLCIILFNTPAHHIDYAINRMIDTGVGVVIALLVNYLLPRSRLEHWFHLDQEERGKGEIKMKKN